MELIGLCEQVENVGSEILYHLKDTILLDC